MKPNIEELRQEFESQISKTLSNNRYMCRSIVGGGDIYGFPSKEELNNIIADIFSWFSQKYISAYQDGVKEGRRQFKEETLKKLDKQIDLRNKAIANFNHKINKL